MGYTITRDGAINVARFQSTVGYDELVDAISDIDAPDSVLEIWDLSRSGIDLPTEAIKSLAEVAKRRKHQPQKAAAVVPNDLLFGLVRMYAAHREPSATQTRAFKNEDDAREWLCASDSS